MFSLQSKLNPLLDIEMQTKEKDPRESLINGNSLSLTALEHALRVFRKHAPHREVKAWKFFWNNACGRVKRVGLSSHAFLDDQVKAYRIYLWRPLERLLDVCVADIYFFGPKRQLFFVEVGLFSPIAPVTAQMSCVIWDRWLDEETNQGGGRQYQFRD